MSSSDDAGSRFRAPSGPETRAFIYEPYSRPIITRARFAGRMLGHAAVSTFLIAISIAIGMIGYIHYERLPWRDAFLNTTMLLGGMGPVNAPQSDGGKLFAGLYALYAGIIFLVAVGVFWAPALHRILHHLHWRRARSGHGGS